MFEKEVAGMYFSGHLLDDYTNHMESLDNIPLSDVSETNEDVGTLQDGSAVLVAGVITAINAKTTKKNEQYESYSFSRAKYRELLTIQANVQSILRDTPEAIREHDQELS